MSWIRTYLAGLMAKGQIGPGWYAILTGLVMLAVARALASAGDTDPVAPYVAVVLAVTGLWSLGRGGLRVYRERLARTRS
jgi:asparagine N-glycosylation enzyme membrane subunit Stt3